MSVNSKTKTLDCLIGYLRAYFPNAFRERTEEDREREETRIWNRNRNKSIKLKRQEEDVY